MKIAPKTYRYRSRRPGQAALETRIKEICATRVRYGYRRVHVLLKREGWAINVKRVRRIYSGLGLQLRNKTPRRRIKAKLRDDRAPATGTHDVWAMDFVHDQLAMGGKIRILTLLDTYSRYAHAIDARAQYRAENVVATLEAVCAKVGYPKTIRVDQGTEFVSRDLDLWEVQRSAEAPGCWPVLACSRSRDWGRSSRQDGSRRPLSVPSQVASRAAPLGPWWAKASQKPMPTSTLRACVAAEPWSLCERRSTPLRPFRPSWIAIRPSMPTSAGKNIGKLARLRSRASAPAARLGRFHRSGEQVRHHRTEAPS